MPTTRELALDILRSERVRERRLLDELPRGSSGAAAGARGAVTEPLVTAGRGRRDHDRAGCARRQVVVRRRRASTARGCGGRGAAVEVVTTRATRVGLARADGARRRRPLPELARRVQERGGRGRRRRTCGLEVEARRRLGRGARVSGGPARRAADGARPPLPVGRDRPAARVALRGRGRSDTRARSPRAWSRNASELDRRITEAADEWTADRLGALERNILRIGVYELDERDVPRGRDQRGGRAGEALRRPRTPASS